MSEEFNWLDYAEPDEEAPAPSARPGLRRFLPRRPTLPSLPGRPRLPSLPSLSNLLRLPSLPLLPRLRRRAQPALDKPSAADLLGVHDERPLDELDDRLQSLRERAGASSQPEAEARQALYDVDEVLAAPEILRKPGGVISAAALSKAQQQQVELLKDIVGAPQADDASLSRIRLSPPLFSLSAIPRIIGTAVLLLMASLPFVSSDFAEGELPPSEFHEDRHGPTTLYNLLDNLTSDDYVLVAFEYGPAAAGELDAIAGLVLRHIVAQRAVPLIVSSDPIAIARAQTIISRINRSVAFSGESLQHGRDYFILRYLPGGSLGLRELSENFADVARVSYKGTLTGLQFDSLDDVTYVVMIAERAEDMRNWAEQVASQLDRTRLLAASGYAAAPLAQVYADSMDEIVGLVVGYRDAYTYAEMLETDFAELLPDASELQLGSAEASPAEIDEQPRNEAAQAERPLATAMPPASATPPPSVAPLPTTTPRPTNTETPTETALPTATATQQIISVVEVTSPQQVRIRRGPTTADDILQLAQAGDMFQVIATNGDGSWFNIALSNGLDGWIAAFLVEEKELSMAEFLGGGGEASARLSNERVYLRREYILSLGKNRPRYYQSNAPVTGDIPEYVLMRDRSAEVPRLRAMTLGTLTTVVTIALGNVIFALGALRRRQRNGERK